MNAESGSGPLDPPPPDDPALLERYLTGECSAAEAARIREWLAEDSAHQDVLAQVREVREAVAETPVWDVKGMWAELSSELEADGAPASVARPAPVAPPARAAFATGGRYRVGRLTPWAMAATVLLAVGAVIALWRVTVAHGPAAAATRIASLDYRDYATRPGERAEFRLTDGTHVLLGVASTLHVPRDYGRGPREVALEGEAYFDVTHDTAHPFRVRAANAVATDLGTRFNVRAYAGDAHVEVMVAAGRVALSASSRSTPSVPAAPVRELAPGDLGVIDTAGLADVRHGVDTTRYLGWVQGRLAFDGARLRDVIPELARWYDLDVRLTDSALANRRLTVTLRDESVSATLDRLALMLDLKVERNGQAVILSPATARSRP